MRRFRWIFALLIVVLVVVLAAGVFLRGQLRRGWPKVDGKTRLPGLLAPVEVLRDKMGVPHIYAENSHDLFFGQGYVHAQDRFWQMEFWRRIGAGRLSEILGESAVGNDRFIRTVGWRRAAEGGPIALVENGDAITIDIPARRINRHISDSEIQARLANWQRPEPKIRRGYLALYARLAESADKGAITRNKG